MCFMAAGPIIGLMGTAMSAVGAQAQASAQAGQMRYNAEVARINARTSRQQGVAEVERISSKYDRLEGTQVATYGRAGVDPSSGSALLVRAASRRDEWLDSNTAIWNRETEAVGFENKARDLDAQAKATKKAGNIAMASTFLTGLGKAAVGGGGAGSPLLIGGA
jgi:hypothetical protein